MLCQYPSINYFHQHGAQSDGLQADRLCMASEDAAKAARKDARKAEKKAARKAQKLASVVAEDQTLPMANASDGVHPLAKRSKTDAGGPSQMDVDAYLALHEITIHEAGAPAPCLSLAAAPFKAPLVQLLMAQPTFTAPSAVQAASWPVAALGRDVLAIAKTGSGKTLGFLLPVLSQCGTAERAAAKGAPLGLIMAPTRELALQIHAEAAKYGACVGVRAVAIYGGASKETQVRALRRGVELIIGTPGRIKDILDTRGGGKQAECGCGAFRLLVLDEADRMLDMGFERDIRDIVWQAFGHGDGYRPHQTFLYSATWPLEVQGIAADLLTEAVKVTVGSGGEKLTASRSVTQRVHVVDGSKRWETFVELIAGGAGGQGSRCIVFANRKDTVASIAKYCQGKGLACECLSGDRSQSQREGTIRRFKAGEVTLVIATDVAARGLDIKGIERVINYELPVDDFQDYVHRIGRTGRAGATGEADSIFTDADRRYAKELTRIMTEAGQPIPPALAKMAPQKIVFDDSD
jgi:ATP-dependent RNA helicase DDX5/DBP2